MKLPDFPGIVSVLLFQLSKIKFALELNKAASIELAKKEIPESGAKGYWDRRAASYDKQYGLRRDHVPSLDKILSGSKPAIKRVIELGCGTGGALRSLAKKYSDTFFRGVDISPEMLRKAREKSAGLGNISFAEMDITNISPEFLREYDLVFVRAALQHLAPEDARKVLSAALDRSGLFYLEELHIRGYRDGAELDYPGFKAKIFYNHDYMRILDKRAKIIFHQYVKGMVLQVLCASDEHKS